MVSDEFDAMVEDKQTLKDKLNNSLVKIEDETKKKRVPKKKGDGLVQTKLDFKKCSSKGKKRSFGSDSEADISVGSDSSDFKTKTAVNPSRERGGTRAATNRKVNYCIDVESDGDNFDSDLELFDNDAVKDEDKVAVTVTLSDSDDDYNNSKRQPDSSNKSTDELFDSLFENSLNNQNNGDRSSDEGLDEDSGVPIAQKKGSGKHRMLSDDEIPPKKIKKIKKT